MKLRKLFKRKPSSTPSDSPKVWRQTNPVRQRARRLRQSTPRRQAKSGRTGRPSFVAEPNMVSLRKWALLIIIVSGIGIVMWYYLWSAAYRIEGFTVTGQGGVAVTSIEAEVQTYLDRQQWLVLPADKIFLFREDDLADHLVRKFSLEGASVQSDGTDWLEIIVEEKYPVMALAAAGQYFLVDKHGGFYEQVSERDVLAKQIPIMLDSLPQLDNYTLGASYLSSDEIEKIAFIQAELEKLEYQVRYMEKQGPASQLVTFRAEDGSKPRIIINLAQDLVEKMEALNIALRDRLNGWESLEYIDMSVEGRIDVK